MPLAGNRQRLRLIEYSTHCTVDTIALWGPAGVPGVVFACAMPVVPADFVNSPVE